MSFAISKLRIGAIGASLMTLSILGLSACSKSTTEGVKPGASKYEISTDIPMGSKDAKVVMVEYASVMCPHCADFQKDIVPQIIENYVKTNKIRYVFREFPTAPVELAAAGHLLIRCVADEKREAMINALMASQREIVVQAQAGAGPKALFTVAASAGMSEADFDKCMHDEAKLKTLQQISEYGANTDKITGTPTIFINGVEYKPPVGKGYEYAEIAKTIDAELAKAK